MLWKREIENTVQLLTLLVKTSGICLFLLKNCCLGNFLCANSHFQSSFSDNQSNASALSSLFCLFCLPTHHIPSDEIGLAVAFSERQGLCESIETRGINILSPERNGKNILRWKTWLQIYSWFLCVSAEWVDGCFSKIVYIQWDEWKDHWNNLAN